MGNELKSVFISVGRTHRPHYETLLVHLIQTLEGLGLRPRVIERTDPSTGRPLDNIIDVMAQCDGAIIIAFERKFFARGIEKRGSTEEYTLSNTVLTTPWSQVETAMAHQKKLPILMLVEEGVHLEGLVDEGYDWYLQYFGKGEDPLSQQNVQNRILQWSQLVKNRVIDLSSGETIDEKVSLGTILKLLSIKSFAQLCGIFASVLALGILVGRYFPATPAH